MEARGRARVFALERASRSIKERQVRRQGRAAVAKILDIGHFAAGMFLSPGRENVQSLLGTVQLARVPSLAVSLYSFCCLAGACALRTWRSNKHRLAAKRH